MSIEKGRELAVFFHMIYELNKGLRNLALFTTELENLPIIKERLKQHKYKIIVEQLSDDNINIFFGNNTAINVLKKFGHTSLKEYTPEEDFILGILLGYSTVEQCNRYVKKHS